MAIELVSRASQTPVVDKTKIPSKLESEKKQAAALRAAINSLRKQLEDVQIHIPDSASSPLSADELRQQKARLQQKLENLQKQIVVTEQSDSASAEDDDKAKLLDELSSEASRLQSILDELRDSNAVIFKPSPDSIQKAWIIDLSGERYRILQIGGKLKELIIRDEDIENRIEQLKRFLSNLDPDKNYFLIMVRPSSDNGFFRVLTLLQNEGFPTGAELIGEKKIVKNQSAKEKNK